VTFIRQRLDAGAPLETAVREGCLVRFRPVLMDGLVAGGGFRADGRQRRRGGGGQRPLATVVIGGILTNTALTLLVLPHALCQLPTHNRTRRRPQPAPRPLLPINR